MMRKKWRILVAGLLVPAMLSGCQLMPAEEVLPAKPVIREYQSREYEQTVVLRGDLILTTEVRCSYSLAKKENLGFTVDGLYIDKVLVSEGQEVKAGEILAQLEQGELQNQIETQEYDLSVLRAKKKHLEENRDLALARHDLTPWVANWEEDRQELEESYALQLRNMEDQIYIQELQLEEMKQNLESRLIRATIDGTVTYVRNLKDGQRSVKGTSIMTVADLDTAVFLVKDEKAQYFPVGTAATILCEDREMKATAVDPSVLGLEEEEEKEIAYLMLDQPDPTLDNGARGYIEVLLDQRIDVLYVHKKAIRSTEGETFVYMLDEDGFRTMRMVTVGMECGDYVEIIDGLEEGESVIMK